MVMANAHLAELIGTRGPHIHLNTAHSSTTAAISVAEDWIRVGRAQRVIVISADVASSKECFKYIGTGFLALGAATTAASPQDAAAPFDVRRSGVVVSAGAVGLVLESATACLRRGGQPKAEVLGTAIGDSAFHPTRLHTETVGAGLRKFLSRMERLHGARHGVRRDSEEFTSKLIYFAHETGTTGFGGGCAKVELAALSSAFDSPAARRHILITNSKGLTGHPIGVGFEDVLATESLARGIVPPVPNLREMDPRLEPFIQQSQLSQGGRHQREFVLRMAAGFGNQWAYVLYKKWTEEQQQRWAQRARESTE
jgi:3-oxoacyl-(acyl-carrier-protein) synthase